MIKILFMIPTLDHGGAEKVLVNLVNNMDKSKFDITVLTIFGGGVNRQFIKPHIKNSYCIKKQFPASSKILALFSPKFLYKCFVKEHYDIIVSYLEGPSARIVSGCTDSDTKLVNWIHCKIDSESEASVGFRNFKEAKECYNKFHYTACVSKMVMDYFKNSLGFDKPMDVFYNTIETNEIRKKAKEKIEDIKFDNDGVNICSVGKIIPIKGFMRLAKIHKKLLESGIENHIYILGIGEERQDIEKYLSENNLTDTFTFLGYNTNPYKYIAKCDLYVCSSYSEGFSTSVTESLIVGTPVVTTLCSGMQEMLGYNNEYGIVTENSEDALYNGIKCILTEDGLLEYYTEKSKERGQYFSTEKTARAVENMLMNLLDSGEKYA